jgi:GntR family transcriptional regulator/MocR family aminotransferase
MGTMARTSSSLDLLVALQRGAAPLHAQLEAQLRDAVRAGRLAPGVRLPSSRALAAELAVSRGVVVEAYEQLAAEGYLCVRAGAAPVVGTIACEPRAAPVPPGPRPPRHDLRPGLPDLSAFPRAAWGGALRRALRELPDAQLGYPDPSGHPRLRAALAGYLGRVRGVAAAPERIVVCGGVAEALRLAATVLRARGATAVAVEDPSHAETQGQLGYGGLEPVPVPVDADGLDVARIPDGVGAVLVTPAHHFPRGIVMTPARRAALVAWAEATGGLILEDDYDAEHRYDRSPVGAIQGLAPERVIHVHSVSKSLAPALRLGWAVAPLELAPALAEAKRRNDLGAPVLEQIALADLIERGELDRHLRRLRPRYRARRDALVGTLLDGRPGLAVEGVAAGLHVAVRLPPGLGEAAAVAAAAERGVAVSTVGEHAVAPRPPGLVLGYGRLPEAGLRAAARELGAALDTAMDAARRTCDNRHDVI